MRKLIKARGIKRENQEGKEGNKGKGQAIERTDSAGQKVISVHISPTGNVDNSLREEHHALHGRCCLDHLMAARTGKFLYSRRLYTYSSGNRHSNDPSQNHQRTETFVIVLRYGRVCEGGLTCRKSVK